MYKIVIYKLVGFSACKVVQYSHQNTPAIHTSKYDYWMKKKSNQLRMGKWRMLG